MRVWWEFVTPNLDSSLEFESGNILETSVAVHARSTCAKSTADQAIRAMSFAQVRGGQICKQGGVSSSPIVSTQSDQAGHRVRAH